MSLSANYPALAPNMLLDFANSKTVDPRITVTRASTATYFNQLGVLTSAANNVPRIDFNPTTYACNGLLVEEQRTNLLVQSEDFATTWIANSATVTTNTIVAPDGALTGDKYIVNSGVSSSSSSVRQDISKAASATTYTWSLFAKKGEVDTLRLIPRDGATSANNVDARFNLTTGAVISVVAAGTFINASAAIQNVGNGWYRCFVTFTSGTETSIRNQIFQLNNNAAFTGNGTDGLFLWGAQLEAAAFSTSYIPTVAATVTRQADAISMTGTAFSGWYNALEGAIYAQASTFDNTNVNRIYSINDNTFNNVIRNTVNGGTLFESGTIVNSGVATTIGLTSYALNVFYKRGFAYKLNDSAYVRNGAVVGTSTSINIPTGINRLIIGGDLGFGFINGYIQRISYYPLRNTNAQLQALTGT